MQLLSEAVGAIIRPPRAEYNYLELPIVLDTGEEDSMKFIRNPLVIENGRKQRIVGSLYHSERMYPMQGGPCIIYLHGNASSQQEGQFLVPNFCPYNCFVFCFDFIGCGCSDGDYVSLGYYETEDVYFLIQFLKNSFSLGKFVLWGRSMGASTVLRIKSPDVVGVIADSPFSSIRDMCTATAVSHKVPEFAAPALIWMLKSRIKDEAKFDIDDVNPIEDVKTQETPCLIGHAKNDKLIPFQQSVNILNEYRCNDKELVELPGGHNSKRKEAWIKKAVDFALTKLGIEHNHLLISECRKLQSLDAHFATFDSLIKDDRRVAWKHEKEDDEEEEEEKKET